MSVNRAAKSGFAAEAQRKVSLFKYSIQVSPGCGQQLLSRNAQFSVKFLMDCNHIGEVNKK
ncbi:CLUMA_CG012218, isoform A [Clunio marinus]|uniref:CLUMA_CG012218, isoform A n=1 Tax=Clunio marinus TaxID=568069 RepID=A0A1J1IEY4_9DIPT|nr:CLUMA_CG012218, isoform A [Clunio marinus]